MAGFDLAVTVVISSADRELLRGWWGAAGGLGAVPRPQPGRTVVFALARLAEPPPGWVCVAVVTTDGAEAVRTDDGAAATIGEPVGGRPDERRRLLLGIVSHLRSDGWSAARTAVPEVAAALREIVAGPARNQPDGVTILEL